MNTSHSRTSTPRATRRRTSHLAICCAIFFLLPLILASLCAAQQPSPSEVVHPNQKIVVNIPNLVAKDSADIPKTAVAIVLNGECRLPNFPSGTSLRALTSKLSGTPCGPRANDSVIRTSYIDGTAIRSDDLIATLQRETPMLLDWSGEILVLYGVIYDEHIRSDGSRDNVIRELLLADPSREGQERNRSFLRGKDNQSEIQGIAIVRVVTK